MAFYSAHTCTVETVYTMMALCRSRLQSGQKKAVGRGTHGETGTSCLCPINVRAGQQREGLRNVLEAAAGVSWQVRTNEFIPIKSWAATESGAPGSCAEHSRVPSPGRGYLPSIDGSGLSRY